MRESLVQGTLVKDFLTHLARVQRASISKAAKSPGEHCSLSLSLHSPSPATDEWSLSMNYCRCQGDSKASCSLLSPQLFASVRLSISSSLASVPPTPPIPACFSFKLMSLLFSTFSFLICYGAVHRFSLSVAPVLPSTCAIQKTFFFKKKKMLF